MIHHEEKNWWTSCKSNDEKEKTIISYIFIDAFLFFFKFISNQARAIIR